MFEVIVANGPSKRVATQAEVNVFIAKVQVLFGADVSIQVNEIQPLFDKDGKEVSFQVKRIKGGR